MAPGARHVPPPVVPRSCRVPPVRAASSPVRAELACTELVEVSKYERKAKGPLFIASRDVSVHKAEDIGGTLLPRVGLHLFSRLRGQARRQRGLRQ